MGAPIRHQQHGCGGLDRNRHVSVNPFEASLGPHAADELARLLKALGVDPDKLAHADPATMRNLQKVCLACEVKGHCRHELATGSAAKNYRGYCPNAITLDQMFGPKSKMAKAPSRPSVAP